MSQSFHNAEVTELQRLARVKTSPKAPLPAFGPELIAFFKQNVQKRQNRFGPVAETWSRLVPEILLEHTALESFNRGQLTVLVDSSSHLYELRQLLLAGLQKQILLACKASGLRKIVLKPGRWYDNRGDAPGDKRIRF